MNKICLGDVAQERKESCKGSKDGFKIVGLEHITPQDINLSSWEEGKENTFTKRFYKGDVLFGRRRAYLKKAAIAPFDGICSGDITVIKAISEKLIPELLPFIIQNDSLFDFAVEKSAGSLSPRVKWEHLKKYEINLPLLDEQKKLAKVLWAAEKTRQGYKSLLNKTDELIKSKFNTILMKKEYNIKTLDSISKHWKKGQSFKKDYISQAGRVFSIHYGELFTKYDPCIRNVLSKTDYSAKVLSKQGDILFPASDVTPAGLARCSALMVDDVLLGGDMIIMRPLAEYNPVYLSYAINYEKEQLLSRVTGAVVRHLAASYLKSVEIPIPSIDLQNKFAEFVQQTDEAKKELQKSLNNLNAMTTALINESLK